MFKLLILLSILSIPIYECVLYSSFWAPRMLNYKVDVVFPPNAGKEAAKNYEKMFGYRGSKLIADLGNGNRPRNDAYDPKIYGPAPIVYIIPETNQNIQESNPDI